MLNREELNKCRILINDALEHNWYTVEHITHSIKADVVALNFKHKPELRQWKVISLISNPHLERPLLPWQHRRQEAPSSSNNQSPTLRINLCDTLMRWGVAQ